MRVEGTFRKALGLLVDLDDDETAAAPNEWNVMTASAPANPAPSGAVPSQAAPKPATPPATAKTVEEVVRQAPGPNLDEIKPVAKPSAPVIDADGAVNFNSIYALASLPTVPFCAEQVLELLATLPADLPIDSKRAAVKVTLNAMAKATGASTEAIVTDASRKLAALASYARSYADQATQFGTKAEAEITALQADIEEKKRLIEEAKTKQSAIVDACTHESDRLDEVLEFFSLDVHPSKYAEGKPDSPKA